MVAPDILAHETSLPRLLNTEDEWIIPRAPGRRRIRVRTGIAERTRVGNKPAGTEIRRRGVYADECRIKYRARRAQNGLAIQLIGDPDPRLKILALRILLVTAGLGRLIHAFESGGGLDSVVIEISDLTELLRVRRRVLVAQAQVQSKLTGHAVIVLKVRGVKLLVQEQRVLESEGAGNGNSEQETGETIASVQRRLIRVGPLRINPVKIKLAIGVLRVVGIELDQLEVRTKLDILPASDDREVILGLPRILRIEASRSAAEHIEIGGRRLRDA